MRVIGHPTEYAPRSYSISQYMSFVLGILASLIAGGLLWLLTHQADVRYLASAHHRRGQVAGKWYSYYLTRDSMTGPRPIWVESRDDIHVSPFGRLRGTSQGQHGKPMTYQLSGTIRGSVLRIVFRNRDAHESQGSVLYPNLLGRDVLVGILIGEDFDQQWYASPSIMSREPLTDERLSELARQIRINRPNHRSPRGTQSNPSSDTG